MSVGFMKNFAIERDVLASALREVAKNPAISKQDFMRAVGIGSTKAEAYKRLLLKLGFVTEGGITPLARLILDFDPLFETEASMWGIHYKLCSNPTAEVWYNMANDFIPGRTSFSSKEAMDFLLSNGIGTPENQHLRSDLSIFLRSYVAEEGFARIGFLQPDGLPGRNIGETRFRKGVPTNISPAIVIFVMFDQVRQRSPNHVTTTIRELLTEDGNVGKIFSLDRERLMGFLRLASSREYGEAVSVSTTAGLDQVVFRFEGSSLEILKMALSGPNRK
jgi:hypothetical protein